MENRFTLYVLIKRYKENDEVVFKPITFSRDESYIDTKLELLKNKDNGDYKVYLVECEETKFSKFPLYYVNMVLDTLYDNELGVF